MQNTCIDLISSNGRQAKMRCFFDAIVPILAVKFEYFNVLLVIDMNKPVWFTFSQYMQSSFSFIKFILATDLSFHASLAIDTAVAEALLVVV